MLGAKAPNQDAYGLFRTMRSHNPPQYSHIVGYTSEYYFIFFKLSMVSIFLILQRNRILAITAEVISATGSA